MSISYIEKEILDTVKILREPSITQIKRGCGLSIPTVKSVCKKLVGEGLLKDVEGYRYAVTDKGLEFSSRWVRPTFDDDAIKDIASKVAEQIGKQISGKKFFTGQQERGINIKTEFIPQIEDETASLISNLGNLGSKLEKEEAQKIEESVNLLKKFKKLRGK